MSAVRVRWEREKRKSAEEPTAKKGRRKAAKAEPAPVAGRSQAHQAPAHGGRGGPGRGPGAGGEGGRAGGARAGAPGHRARGAGAGADARGAGPGAVQGSAARPGRVRGARPRPRSRTRAGTAGAVPPAPGTHRAAGTPTRAPFIPPRIQRPPRAARAAAPSRSSAAAHRRAVTPGRPVAARAAAPTAAPRRRPRAASGPTPRRAAGGRRARRASARRWIRTRCRPTSCKTLQGMKGPAGRKGVRRPDEPSFRERAGRPAGRGAGAGEDPHPGQRVHLGLRARRRDEGAGHPDRPVRLQGAGPHGDGEPAPRLRPDRADRVGLRLPGGAGGRVRGRGRDRQPPRTRPSS